MNEADCSDYDDHSDVGIDLSRCEQFLGGKTQIYGCGLGLLWVLEMSRRNPKLSISELLLELDNFIDEFGLGAVALRRADALDNSPTASWYELVNSLGWVSRARRVEVGQALFRLRGLEFTEADFEEDEATKAAKREAAIAEERKRHLAQLWETRRAGRQTSRFD
jgi:hypothetical protein